jgi:PEP-CTERM motif
MRLSALAVASLLAACTTSLFAVPFTPYSNVGNPITTSSPVTYTGANGLGGGIIAYFYSVSAADTDTISVYDATTHSFLSPTGAFNNQSPSTPGSSVIFDSASLHNGDTLYFDLYNTSYSNDVFSSSTSISSDGENHAYITSFNGTIGSYGNIVGTYVGMEDLPNHDSDWDYNDDTFVFANVNPKDPPPAPTPEPGTFALLGTGLLGAAGAIRRKFAR